MPLPDASTTVPDSVVNATFPRWTSTLSVASCSGSMASTSCELSSAGRSSSRSAALICIGKKETIIAKMRNTLRILLNCCFIKRVPSHMFHFYTGMIF